MPDRFGMLTSAKAALLPRHPLGKALATAGGTAGATVRSKGYV